MSNKEPFDKYLVIDLTDGFKYYYKNIKEASRKVMELESYGNTVQIYQLVYSGGMILVD